MSYAVFLFIKPSCCLSYAAHKSIQSIHSAHVTTEDSDISMHLVKTHVLSIFTVHDAINTTEVLY